jgi:hypothetical protein
MQNGDSLNLGDYFKWGYDLLAIPDGAVIIPFVGDSNKYYVIHTNLDYVDIPSLGEVLLGSKLYYDVIDMSLDGGNGGIVTGEKEIVFFE